ncbi:inosose isomerase [Abditibacteriota bacterium]|nr:inosose isomerase [Abditibacteriota bacterium]
MFKTCLNTSTLRGFKLPLAQSVQIAAQAGFQAIEPWIDELQAHEASGNSLEDLAQQIRDAGLSVQGAIGFAEWIVDDEARRKAGLETARRDMELVAKVGGHLIAAPPMGAVETSGLSLESIAERYAALCEIGREFGVRPLVEVWGFSQTLSRLGEAVFVAIESGAPEACVLADVYHLYKGGSPLEGLSLLNGAALPIFHVNDYPTSIAPATITDADRVFPGDGDAPLAQIFQTLHSIGFDGFLSLELFNPAYWQGNPLEIARIGHNKLSAALSL